MSQTKYILEIKKIYGMHLRYVIFITENDIWKQGVPVYQIERMKELSKELQAQ
ncbi:MAG: hypothetical protein PUG60_15340 [Lachnospiraceae bacterium]|nr:hypothetical protein [Lachnospiraceae bacterium]